MTLSQPTSNQQVGPAAPGSFPVSPSVKKLTLDTSWIHPDFQKYELTEVIRNQIAYALDSSTAFQGLANSIYLLEPSEHRANLVYAVSHIIENGASGILSALMRKFDDVRAFVEQIEKGAERRLREIQNQIEKKAYPELYGSLTEWIIRTEEFRENIIAIRENFDSLYIVSLLDELLEPIVETTWQFAARAYRGHNSLLGPFSLSHLLRSSLIPRGTQGGKSYDRIANIIGLPQVPRLTVCGLEPDATFAEAISFPVTTGSTKPFKEYKEFMSQGGNSFKQECYDFEFRRPIVPELKDSAERSSKNGTPVHWNFRAQKVILAPVPSFATRSAHPPSILAAFAEAVIIAAEKNKIQSVAIPCELEVPVVNDPKPRNTILPVEMLPPILDSLPLRSVKTIDLCFRDPSLPSTIETILSLACQGLLPTP